jgi:hypothetical protein
MKGITFTIERHALFNMHCQRLDAMRTATQTRRERGTSAEQYIQYTESKRARRGYSNSDTGTQDKARQHD